MTLNLFDTHAHLHFPEFDGDREAMLGRARAAGVQRMLTIGTEPESSRAAVALAAREADVWATVGIHPHDAASADAGALAAIERLAAEPRVVALGEIGLDYFLPCRRARTSGACSARCWGWPGVSASPW